MRHLSIELEVAQAARNILEVCDNMLKRSEDTSSLTSPDDTGLVASDMHGVQESDFVGLGADLGWESFFPDTGVGHSWLGNNDS